MYNMLLKANRTVDIFLSGCLFENNFVMIMYFLKTYFFLVSVNDQNQYITDGCSGNNCLVNVNIKTFL